MFIYFMSNANFPPVVASYFMFSSEKLTREFYKKLYSFKHSCSFKPVAHQVSRVSQMCSKHFKTPLQLCGLVTHSLFTHWFSAKHLTLLMIPHKQSKLNHSPDSCWFIFHGQLWILGWSAWLVGDSDVVHWLVTLRRSLVPAQKALSCFLIHVSEG